MCVFVISRLHYNGTPDRSSAHPPPRYFSRASSHAVHFAHLQLPPRTVSSPRGGFRHGPPVVSDLVFRRANLHHCRVRTRPNRPPSTRRPPSRGRVRVSSRVSVRVWVWDPSRGVISPVVAHRRPSLSPGEARRTEKTPTPARRRVNRGAPVDEGRRRTPRRLRIGRSRVSFARRRVASARRVRSGDGECRLAGESPEARRLSTASASSLEIRPEPRDGARESAPSTSLTVFKPSCLAGVNIVIVGTSMPLALAFLCACSSRWRSMRLSRDEVVDARDAGDGRRGGGRDGDRPRRRGFPRRGRMRMRERGDVPGNEGFGPGTGPGTGPGSLARLRVRARAPRRVTRPIARRRPPRRADAVGRRRATTRGVVGPPRRSPRRDLWDLPRRERRRRRRGGRRPRWRARRRRRARDARWTS